MPNRFQRQRRDSIPAQAIGLGIGTMSESRRAKGPSDHLLNIVIFGHKAALGPIRSPKRKTANLVI